MQIFPTTRWSLFEAASSDDPDLQQAAVARIVVRYSHALQGHITRRRLADTDDVDDLLQSFIANRLLATDLIRRVDKKRGRFRHFIRRVLTDYAIEQMRYKAAGIRSPGRIVSLDETMLSKENSSEAADRTYDREWGKQVVSEAIRLMEQECGRIERNDLWEVFEARLLRPLFENDEPEPYRHLARRLDVPSPGKTSNLLVTCKRMFGRVVRDVVSEYLFSDREVDDEIRELFLALSEPNNVSRLKS